MVSASVELQFDGRTDDSVRGPRDGRTAPGHRHHDPGRIASSGQSLAPRSAMGFDHGTAGFSGPGAAEHGVFHTHGHGPSAVGWQSLGRGRA